MKQLSRIEIIRKNVSIQRISMGGVLVACLVFSLAVNIKPANADKPDRAVHALFNLRHPETGPFPTDIFTITDHTQNTGRRVNLPYPDCTIRVSDCEDLDVVNTLDGFGLQTRLSIPFDGSIDVNTATSDTVFLISLGSTIDRAGDPPGTVIGINQIVWDTFTDTLHVEIRRAAHATHALRAHRHQSGARYKTQTRRGERELSSVPADSARRVQAGAARGYSRGARPRRTRTRHSDRECLYDAEHHFGDGENSGSDQDRHAGARQLPARSEG